MVHAASSLIWIGAVAGFAAVAAAGASLPLASPGIAGIYLSLEILTWALIVPSAVASFISGVLHAIATPWGLFRHYWVIFKLVLTSGALALLLLHVRVVNQAAALALADEVAHLEPLRMQLLFDSVAAVAVLLLIAVLGWLKPKGVLPQRAAWTRSTRSGGSG